MTIEERFERIEHFAAGLAEERRKDREEYRMLWRDTQRQLNEASTRLNDLTLQIAEVNDLITRMAEDRERAERELRAEDKHLGERIDAPVSAIGKFVAREASEA